MIAYLSIFSIAWLFRSLSNLTICTFKANCSISYLSNFLFSSISLVSRCSSSIAGETFLLIALSDLPLLLARKQLAFSLPFYLFIKCSVLYFPLLTCLLP